MIATCSDSSSRIADLVETGRPVHIETPKSHVHQAAEPVEELHVERLVEAEPRALGLDHLAA